MDKQQIIALIKSIPPERIQQIRKSFSEDTLAHLSACIALTTKLPDMAQEAIRVEQLNVDTGETIGIRLVVVSDDLWRVIVEVMNSTFSHEAVVLPKREADDDGETIDRERLGRALVEALHAAQPGSAIPYLLEDRAEAVRNLVLRLVQPDVDKDDI
jgi:hypothetical protein